MVVVRSLIWVFAWKDSRAAGIGISALIQVCLNFPRFFVDDADASRIVSNFVFFHCLYLTLILKFVLLQKYYLIF